MIVKILTLLGLCCFSVSSLALEYYGGVEFDYVQNQVSSAEFRPLAIGGRLGRYIEPGLGLEVQGLIGLDSDEDIGIESELNYNLGVAARFETPETDGGKLYFLLGYAISELELDRSGTGKPGSEAFDGFSYGAGLEFRLGNSEQLFLNLQIIRYDAEDDIEIDGVGLGIRFGL